MAISIGRRVDSMAAIERPGDYYLNEAGTVGANDRALWFCLPIDDPAGIDTELPDGTTYKRSPLLRITEPPWTFRECPDGSIEVRASILTYQMDGTTPRWHGYLDEGHAWREC